LFDQPQHEERAEFVVLASVLHGSEPLGEAIERLSPHDFNWRQNRLVFEAVLGLFEKNHPVDPVSIMEELRARGTLEDVGADYIGELVEGVPHTDHIEHHCKLVRDASARRKLAGVCQATLTKLGAHGEGTTEEILEAAERGIFDISHNVASGQPERLSDILNATMDVIRRRKASGEETFGIRSGFPLLDHTTGGFHDGELYILAARPSMGKTSLAINFIDYIGVTKELPTLMFSLEMTKQDVALRVTSLRTGVPMRNFRATKFLNPDDLLSISRQQRLIDTSPIVIDDQPGASILAMRAKARRQMIREPFKVLVIDYLQLMNGGSVRHVNRNEEISYISRNLKDLARELGVPVIALSQLSRAPEQRPDRRPMLSDLRDSGSIEQDADCVMFLYRPEYYFGEVHEGRNIAGKTEVNVAKNRNGPTATVNFTFRKETMKFYEEAMER